MFRLVLIFVLFNVCIFVNAGFDQHDASGKVIAYFTFDRMKDEGPREYSIKNEGTPTIVNIGKFGKSMQMIGADKFNALSRRPFGITTGDGFAITLWLKLQEQKGSLLIAIGGIPLPHEKKAGGIIYLTLSSDILLAMSIDIENDEMAVIPHLQELPIFDNKWHHIVYTKNMRSTLEGLHEIYIDGEVIAKGVRDTGGFIGLGGGGISIEIIDDIPISGSIFIDDLGFFETGFSVYEVKALYEVGLEKFLTAMPVNPQESIATTWGTLKQR